MGKHALKMLQFVSSDYLLVAVSLAEHLKVKTSKLQDNRFRLHIPQYSPIFFPHTVAGTFNTVFNPKVTSRCRGKVNANESGTHPKTSVFENVTLWPTS